MTPTVTVFPSSPGRGTANAAAGTASAPMSGSATAFSQRGAGVSRSTSSAIRAPHRATAKLTSGAPPSAA
ncbi:hypothetical protein ACFQX6_19020 [Streptosporangium lutulentum]